MEEKGKWLPECWVLYPEGSCVYICSNCKELWHRKEKICPNCKAEMELDYQKKKKYVGKNNQD